MIKKINNVANLRMRGVAAVAVAATVFALTACNSSGSGQSTTPSGGSVVVSEFEMDHLTPGWGNGYNSDQVSALFAPLVNFDADGNMQLVQAESITTPDNLVWTVKIKPGWTFHNGEEVTAQSYVDGANTVAYGPNKWGGNYLFANVEGYEALNPANGRPTSTTMSGLKVIDAQTFQVTLVKPDSQLQVMMTGGWTVWSPLPKVALADLAAYDKAPIGNGPFQMDGVWENTTSSVKVKAYEAYKGTKPKVSNIEFRTYTSAETAYTDLLAGAVDLNGAVTKPPPAKLAQIKSDFSGRVVTHAQVYPQWIGFPLKDERFSDVRIRQAISMSIDRQAITSKLFDGMYTPATGILAPGTIGGATDNCGEYCKFDPVEAKALLAAAGGWSGPMELQYVAGKGLEAYVQAVANTIRQNLGISDVTLVASATSAEYATALRAGAKGPFFSGWNGYPTPQDILHGVFQEGISWRSGFYSSAAVDSLMEKAQSAKTPEEATRLFQDAEAQVMKDFPVVPVFNYSEVTAYSDRIEKPVLNVYGPLYDQIALK